MIIGGLDVGTTGCKIALYDDKAKLLGTYYNEYDSVHKDGQHEINFEDIKKGVLKLLKNATSEHRVDAFGVTSFGETFAMLDENDNILAPSMLYTDPRGVDECRELCDKLGIDKLTLIAGVKPHQMYSIYKIMWLKKNNPEAFSKCKRVLLGEDYIVYSLTGVAQIQYSLAALAGAALGGFDDLAATVAKMAPVRKVFKPDNAKTKIYAEYYEKYAKLYDEVRSLVI